MKLFAPTIKIASLAFIAYLVFQVVGQQGSPDLSLRVADVSVDSDSRPLKPVKVTRVKFTKQVVQEINSKNLFRKQRSQHLKSLKKKPPTLPQAVKPVAEEPITVAKQFIPAPRVSLVGVVLIPGGSIAFLEGEYAIDDGKSAYIPLKAKQFVIGDRIGEYKITKIERDRVMLKTSEGDIMQLKLNDMD